MPPELRQQLHEGLVIPAMPLVLSADRKMDERRQRALLRYYEAAGAGGLAVGVHTTQFAIRDPKIGLFEPVLRLAAATFDELDQRRDQPLVRIAGVCGHKEQALAEATLVRESGYHAGLLSLAALHDADDDALVDHCRAVAEVIPVVGFYLQASVGGRPLSYRFWRRFFEIENVVAVKIAAFNRYHTIDCVRAAVESGRDDIALYTGNDDNIVLDLLTPYRFQVGGRPVERRFVGGLLGHWAVWTRCAVELLERCQRAVESGAGADENLLRLAVEVTDMNAALFDVAHSFAGCIAGIHEVLRRQGLLAGVWCLDEKEGLSSGQAQELDRVSTAYPNLTDDRFVAEHLDRWLAD